MGKIALVLAGGVAKGAYEAGALKALAEVGVQPDVIVGISAGALNGAMAATLLASSSFTPENVDALLCRTWREEVTLGHFWNASDGENALNHFERRSLNNVLMRLGVDPFRSQYLPTRLGLDVPRVLETLLRGEFVSLFSHAYMRQLSQKFSFPHRIHREVKLSAVLCDLLGGVSYREDGDELVPDYSHFEDFHWYPKMPRTDNFVQFNRLLDVVMASSSFPLVFPPMRLKLPDRPRTGLFVDGGLCDSSPISKAISMDQEIDTVIVVMATTRVDPLAEEPQNVLQIGGRLSEILAGKYLIHDYQHVQAMNRRIQALSQVLQKDADGQYLPSEFNELICRGAGFGGLADFATHRLIRVLPVLPRARALAGDPFAGFQSLELMDGYIELGYQDAKRVLAERWKNSDDLGPSLLSATHEPPSLEQRSEQPGSVAPAA